MGQAGVRSTEGADTMTFILRCDFEVGGVCIGAEERIQKRGSNLGVCSIETVVEATDVGKIIRKGKVCREARKEKRRERSRGREGGRGSRDREVGVVWPLVTQPEENFHQLPPRHLLILPVRTCTRLACHLTLPSQGHPCTTVQSPLPTQGQRCTDALVSPVSCICLLSLSISTSTGHSLFHRLPPLFPHFSESKTL